MVSVERGGTADGVWSRGVIAVEAAGRLGNQMFQYAFGLAAARRLGTEFAFDESTLDRLFVLGFHHVDGEVRELPSVSVWNESYDEPEEVLAALEDERRYKGFFQSERFFSDANDDVRTAFRLLPEHQQAFRDRYGDLLVEGYVCCHVRRTDYESFAGGAALPISYYESGLRRLGVTDDTPVVFIGDDLAEARGSFGARPAVRFEQNAEAVDLQLLVNAEAIVVSNSTFGWWGAWLNDRAAGRVVAPRHWLGFRSGWEYPPHVVPSRWTEVPVQLPWRTRLSPTRLRMVAGRTRQRITGRIGRK